jgi:hypothetical protein
LEGFWHGLKKGTPTSTEFITKLLSIDLLVSAYFYIFLGPKAKEAMELSLKKFLIGNFPHTR